MTRTVLRLFFLLVALAPAGRAGEYVLTPRWITGGTGSGVGEYGIPESVAIDSLGRVVVTDKGRMMLHVYALADGRPLFDVGTHGTALGSFDRPNGIAVDPGGRIFLTEEVNRRVQILDREYRPLGQFRRAGASSFSKPMGITIDRTGRVFVTDAGREQVDVFDGSGAYLFSLSKQPSLASVESIEIDSLQQRILVCDEGHARVNFYDMQGRYLSSFGSQGSGPGQFGDVPNAVRLDTRGRIYIDDQGNSRINVYRSDTRWLASFYCAGRAMSSADGMTLSEPDNVLIVADQGNDRVLGFDLGEIQCRLAREEIEPAPALVGALQTSVDSLGLEATFGLVWVGARVEIEAAAATDGDPSRIEATVLHARTAHAPRGIDLPLVETGPATNRFTGRFTLQPTTSEDSLGLAAGAGDTLRVHVGGEADALVAPIVALPSPVASGVRVLQAVDGRVGTDSPTLVWQGIDPAGLRHQTAAQVRVRRPDGSLHWQSTILPGGIGRCRYTGPALPGREWLQAEVRVAFGTAWSAWSSTPLQRAVLPVVLWPVGLAPTALVRVAAIRLRALVQSEEEVSAVCFEVSEPGKPLRRLPAGLPRDGIVEAHAELPLAEDVWVRWRVVLLSPVARIAGPWWSVALDATGGPPRGPNRYPPVATAGRADSCVGRPPVAGRRGEPTAEVVTSLGPAGGIARRGAWLSVALPGGARSVEVFDARGRRVRQARSEPNGAWRWDGLDRRGALLPPGVYFVRAGDAPPHRTLKVVWTGR